MNTYLKKHFEEVLNYYDQEFKAACRTVLIKRQIDEILLLTLARSHKTTRSVYYLCSNRFGQQAGILSRTIFESLIDISYLIDNNSEQLSRIYTIFPLIDFYEHLKRIRENDIYQELEEEISFNESEYIELKKESESLARNLGISQSDIKR